MSANIQTLTGPAPQPSEVPAGTTSANAGRKRRSPAKRADVVRNGGRKWTLEEVGGIASVVNIETDYACRNVISGCSATERRKAALWPTKMLAGF